MVKREDAGTASLWFTYADVLYWESYLSLLDHYTRKCECCQVRYNEKDNDKWAIVRRLSYDMDGEIG